MAAQRDALKDFVFAQTNRRQVAFLLSVIQRALVPRLLC